MDQVKSGDVQENDISNKDKNQAKGQENIDDLNKEKGISPEDYHGILDRDNEVNTLLYGPSSLTDDEFSEIYENIKNTEDKTDSGEGK